MKSAPRGQTSAVKSERFCSRLLAARGRPRTVLSFKNFPWFATLRLVNSRMSSYRPASSAGELDIDQPVSRSIIRTAIRSSVRSADVRRIVTLEA
jgi:hypothetical protein